MRIARRLFHILDNLTRSKKKNWKRKQAIVNYVGTKNLHSTYSVTYELFSVIENETKRDLWKAIQWWEIYIWTIYRIKYLYFTYVIIFDGFMGVYMRQRDSSGIYFLAQIFTFELLFFVANFFLFQFKKKTHWKMILMEVL